MKLVELKALKKENIYKRILDALKIRGLDKLYIKRTKTVDYVDIILAVVQFLDQNKNVLKNITKKQYENIVIIIIDEILEEMGVEMEEEKIEKILELLKNSLLVKKVSEFLIEKVNIFFKSISKKCCKETDVVEPVGLNSIQLITE